MQKLFSWFENQSLRFYIVFLGIVYAITHLVSLTALPVFADEAIYIRWAQLIMDDPGRYIFFPMNDGKTPLFIWLLIPFQYLWRDPLFAGRVVSVLDGAVQVWLMTVLVKKMGGGKVAQVLGALLVSILPYWYFHHRMALMDGLLTVFGTAAFVLVISLMGKSTEASLSKNTNIFSFIYNWVKVFFTTPRNWWGFIAAGICFGAALWTKIPAILLVPSLYVVIFLKPKLTWQTFLDGVAKVSVVVGIGLVVFAILKISPVFSQLFSRGSDFLFPISSLFKDQIWKQTLPSTSTYLSYFISYLSLAGVLLPVIGLLLFPKHRRLYVVLLVSALLFSSPIVLLGKVVYPRYFLPAVIFVTAAAALALEDLVEMAQDKQRTQFQSNAATLLLICSALSIAVTSGRFIFSSLTNANAIPFVQADIVQYETEWSSGHGVYQTFKAVQSEAQHKKIIVATEGYFGTLPDALLMYFHREDVSNVRIEGIGQPVREIPKEFKTKAVGYDEAWLVVNSHRMQMELPKEALKFEYCRPYSGPCLEVWNINAKLQ